MPTDGHDLERSGEYHVGHRRCTFFCPNVAGPSIIILIDFSIARQTYVENPEKETKYLVHASDM